MDTREAGTLVSLAFTNREIQAALRIYQQCGRPGLVQRTAVYFKQTSCANFA
jgi:hypothetical protein